MTTDEIIRRYGDEDGFIECADCPVHPKCAGYMSGFEDCWEKIGRYVSGEGEKRAAMMTGEKIPCSLCRYAPPSAGDGKPCTCCPAEGVN